MKAFGLDALAGLLPEGGDVHVEHRVDEVAGQLDVAVAQQRHQVVLARALERVLEVDHHQLAVLHHEVAALVVAVGEAARGGGQLLGDAAERGVELGALGAGGHLAAPGLQAPLAEVVQLPVVELFVEGAGEGEAARVGVLLGAGAQPGQQLDGLGVEPGAIAGGERRLEGLIRQVLADHHPRGLVEAEDLRHADAQLARGSGAR